VSVLIGDTPDYTATYLNATVDLSWGHLIESTSSQVLTISDLSSYEWESQEMDSLSANFTTTEIDNATITTIIEVIDSDSSSSFAGVTLPLSENSIKTLLWVSHTWGTNKMATLNWTIALDSDSVDTTQSTEDSLTTLSLTTESAVLTLSLPTRASVDGQAQDVDLHLLFSGRSVVIEISVNAGTSSFSYEFASAVSDPPATSDYVDDPAARKRARNATLIVLGVWNALGAVAFSVLLYRDHQSKKKSTSEELTMLKH